MSFESERISRGNFEQEDAEVGGFENMEELFSTYKEVGGENVVSFSDINHNHLNLNKCKTLAQILDFIDKVHYVDIKDEEAIYFVEDLLEDRGCAPEEGFEVDRYRLSDDLETMVSYTEEFEKFCEDWGVSF